MNKHILILVGAKGSGKSTIGCFLASSLGVYFLRVEPVFLDVAARVGRSSPEFEGLGFEAVHACLLQALRDHPVVCFESTGVSPYFSNLVAKLEGSSRVSLIHVLAAPSTCLHRVRSRDTSIHIPVSDHQVEHVNTLAHAVRLPWALEVDNNRGFDEAGIRDVVQRLLVQ